MEISDDNFTIVVDSKQFVAHPGARMTLDGAKAVLTYALMTGEHEKLNTALVKMLTFLMHEYKGKKPKGWGDSKKGWQ